MIPKYVQCMYKAQYMYNATELDKVYLMPNWTLKLQIWCNQILPPCKREAQSKPVKPPKHRCPTLCNCVKTKVT